MQFELHLLPARLERAGRIPNALTFTLQHGIEREPVAAFHRLRFGDRDVVTEIGGAARTLLPCHAGDRALDALAIRGKHRGGRPQTESGDGHTIRRRQPIDERVRGLRNRQRAAKADVRLVDRNDDQTPAAGRFVRAVAVGRRRRVLARRRRGERHPLRADDLSRGAVDPHDEIVGLQIGNRFPAIVDDGDVERGDLDGRFELRLLVTP